MFDAKIVCRTFLVRSRCDPQTGEGQNCGRFLFTLLSSITSKFAESSGTTQFFMSSQCNPNITFYSFREPTFLYVGSRFSQILMQCPWWINMYIPEIFQNTYPSFWKNKCPFQGAYAFLGTGELYAYHDWRVFSISVGLCLCSNVRTYRNQLLFPTVCITRHAPLCSYWSRNVIRVWITRSFLNEKYVATSRTTPCNTQGNGQVEWMNEIVWKSITLALKSKGLAASQWELVLMDAPHSLRSLLCTVIETTLNEQLLSYNRKSTSKISMQTRFPIPGPATLRRRARSSEYKSLVDELDLVHSNF